MSKTTASSSPPVLTPTSPQTGFLSATRLTTSPLDAGVEYLDADGIPRRSSSVSHRMLKRGHVVANAQPLTEDEQAHTAQSAWQQDAHERCHAMQEANERWQQRQRANAEMKCATQQARQQWLSESDELVTTRLTLWYDASTLPRDAVEVTERNTSQQPSRSKAFFDGDGNLRRQATRPAGPTMESSLV